MQTTCTCTCTWACMTFCCSIRRLLLSWRVSMVLISSLSLPKEKRQYLLHVSIKRCSNYLLLESLSVNHTYITIKKWHSYWEFRTWVCSYQDHQTCYARTILRTLFSHIFVQELICSMTIAVNKNQQQLIISLSGILLWISH